MPETEILYKPSGSKDNMGQVNFEALIDGVLKVENSWIPQFMATLGLSDSSQLLRDTSES